MATIIDGKVLSEKIISDITNTIKEKQLKIGFAAIIVGEDPASKMYVSMKKKKCENIGIHFEEYALPENISNQELLALIKKLNKREDIHAILVQHPLPNHIDEKLIWENIEPKKDVDGFNPKNVGKLCSNEECFVACTPLGVIEMLKEYNIQISGKNCVVVGRSNIVGKPMAMLLLNNNGTVTICHSKTKNLAEICKTADILIVAIGKPKMITKDMVKKDAVVIDVGINKIDGKTVGDVDFDEVKKVASYITPVPGGVGPMTIAMLMKNTLKAKNKIEGDNNGEL